MDTNDRDHLKIKRIPWKHALLTGIFVALLNGFFPELSGVLWSIFTIFLYAVIYYDSINTTKNLQIAIYSIIFFGMIMCINGLFEYITGSNYLREIQQSLSVKGAYFSENALVRFGVTRRVCSCIPHSIGYGTVCSCFLFIIFYIIYRTKMHLNIFIVSISLLLLAIGIVLSGSRSPLLGLAVMVLPILISRETFKLRNMMLIVFVVVVSIYFAGDFIIQMFESMVNEDKAAEASGSSIEMRQRQLNITLMIWSRNPVFGHGNVSIDYFNNFGQLSGAESLWFQLLLRRGLVGLVGFVFFYFFVFRDIILTQKERMFKFAFWSGWIIINTVTSLPGLTDFLSMMVLCLMYKLEQFGFVVEKRRMMNYKLLQIIHESKHM